MTLPHPVRQLLAQFGLDQQQAPSVETWSEFVSALPRLMTPPTADTDISWPRRMIQQLGVMILVVDKMGKVQYSNSQCDWVLGGGTSLAGRLVHGLLTSPLDGLRLGELFRRAMHGERLNEVDITFRVAKDPVQDLTLSCLIMALPELEPVPAPAIKLEEEADEPLVGDHIVLMVFPSSPSSQPASSSKVPDRQGFYEAILNAMPAPIAIFDANQRYLFCNAAAIRNTEIREWVIGKSDEEYINHRNFNPQIAENRQAHFLKATQQKTTVAFEEKLFTPQGGTVYQLRTYTPVFAADGSLSFCIGHGMNITELKRAQNELEALNSVLSQRMEEKEEQLQQTTAKMHHDAFHDSLTSLPNRALFEDRLTQAMHRASQQIRSEPQYAVIYLDTDRFKGVNDTYGHPAGDALLIELADRLQESVRPTDTVARMGGDEFALLIEPLFSAQHAEVVAEQIQNELRRPLQVQSIDMTTSVSIGVVLGNSDYTSAMEILRDADIAMYKAKEAGRAGHQVFNKKMREHTIRINQTEAELRLALERHELRLIYQPIVKLATQQIIGLEALVRWQHPERGLVGPNEFIHVAEEFGLMSAIDRWVFREACIQMRRWQETYPKDPMLDLSVNVSADHFGSVDMLEYFHSILQQTNFDPKRLNLEITEGAFLAQPQQLGERLRRLRKLGISLHLDDFGTGYSSLSYLHTLPLDTLKIDRSFIHSMLTNASSAELVRTIVAMAKNMEMSIVAEGVENQQQLNALRELACECGQGYFFAKPMPWQDARAFISSLQEGSGKGKQR